MRSEKATIVEQSMQDKDSLMAAMHDFEAQVHASPGHAAGAVYGAMGCWGV